MPNRAFTLIEVLIVLGILAVLGAVTVSMSPGMYRGYTSRAARDQVVVELMHARAEALNGVVGGGQSHGISFALLSGDAVPATLTFVDSGATSTITIGSEGQISWTH
jgi:prepilin-type N-terminal cleavage/methylation domain-containing protein